MTWIPVAIGAAVGLGSLIFVVVMQRQLYVAKRAQSTAAVAMEVAGERIRELTAELLAQNQRTREQLAVMEAEIVELEQFIAQECANPRHLLVDRAQYFASLQSLRDAARRLEAPGVRGDSPAGPGADGSFDPI
jgi:hypothetical protein